MIFDWSLKISSEIFTWRTFEKRWDWWMYWFRQDLSEHICLYVNLHVDVYCRCIDIHMEMSIFQIIMCPTWPTKNSVWFILTQWHHLSNGMNSFLGTHQSTYKKGVKGVVSRTNLKWDEINFSLTGTVNRNDMNLNALKILLLS